MADYLSPAPHMHISFVIFFIALGVLLVAALTITLVQVFRSRGKPPVERKTTGLLAGAGGFGYAGKHMGGGPANANAPGMFLINSVQDPNRPDAEPEDPRTR